MSKMKKVIDPCKTLSDNILSVAGPSGIKDNIRTLFEGHLPPGDVKEINGELKKTLVLSYQKPKRTKSKPIRKSKKPLTAKEKRSLGLYRLPKKGLKYSSFEALNSMWNGYMKELLDLESLESGGWSPNLNEVKV